jgi:hypothetical protein
MRLVMNQLLWEMEHKRYEIIQRQWEIELKRFELLQQLWDLGQ